jgi:4-hydroxy-3-methylbut-2-enyl diphosphate reductase
MVEVALEHGAPAARLINDATALDLTWLDGVDTVGLTSGASAPEVLVDQVIAALMAAPRGATVETVEVVDEQMHFALPAALRRLQLAAG